MQPNTPLARMILESGKPAYQVAGEAGITPWLVYSYASGKRGIPPAHIVRLCSALDCAPEDLIE